MLLILPNDFFDFSVIPPPVSGTFAGDMRNLYLSDVATSSLVYRSFSSSELVEEKGTSYYGMLKGKVRISFIFYTRVSLSFYLW